LLAPTLIDVAWRVLRLVPSLAAWKVIHRLSPPLYIPHTGRREASWRFLGYELYSPLGTAAGLDKDARMVWLPLVLGLGFHVVGSVLARPWPGVKPKLLLRLRGGATLNRLGLPSHGLQRVRPRLARAKRILDEHGVRLAVNIAGFSVDEYVEVARSLAPYADWLEVNISCPNVEEHRSFEEPDEALRLCRELKPHPKPVLIKIPPTTDGDLLAQYVDVVRECGAAGLVIANTLRVSVAGTTAGLGGRPLYRIVKWMVSRAREYSGTVAIVAVGGIDSWYSAIELLEAGANLVEVYSSLLYMGPLHVASMSRALHVYGLMRGNLLNRSL
jgi:dihydroorotate dehydrogenase